MCLEKTIFDDLYLKLNKKQEKHQNICKIAIIVQQTFVSLEHVLKTSSTHVLKTVSRRLQRNNFTSSKTSWRRLEDILQDVLKTSWKTKNCYAEDVLKTCLEDVLKTLWRQAKYLLGISVPNKSKCVSNKSIFNEPTFDNSKASPKCIK